MRKAVSISIALVLCALPFSAAAHATPVTYTPASGAVLVDAPLSVSILFSEHVDPQASAIQVLKDGKTVSEKPNTQSTTRTLTVPIESRGDGTYTVEWSVVSQDDGHFTRGEYSFGVGVSAQTQVEAPTFELVTASTASEAFGMTVELLGNGVLWALIVLFAFGVRPLLPRFEAERPLLLRGYKFFGWFGIVCALVGQVLELIIKMSDLASLQSISIWSACNEYIFTAAGSATLARMLAIIVVAAVFTASYKKIYSSPRFTWYEGVLVVSMCVFAFFRAIISHATANPFYPKLSIAVNFVHVIEKDIWAGIALALLLFVLAPRLRIFLRALVVRASVLLAIDLSFVGITAAYIVWLHLENFGNLLSTSWGEALLPLLVTAVLLVFVRTFSTFVRTSPVTIGAESMLSLLVVYFSSVIILTSPPLPQTRNLDAFGMIVACTGIAGFAWGMLLAYISRRRIIVEFTGRHALWGAGGASLTVIVLLFVLPFLGVANEFKKECVDDGNMWHYMLPQKAGIPTSNTPREGCMWGMGAYPYLFADKAEYDRYRALPPAKVELAHAALIAGTPAQLQVSITDNGKPAPLFVDMDKLIHMVIISRDQTVFAHIHSSEQSSPFTFTYTFPKAGEYIVAIDYAHGLTLESKQFIVTVGGAPQEQKQEAQYPSEGEFGGFHVELKYPQPFAGDVVTFTYTITKDGKPVTNVVPYLDAAMHISVVKNDLSTFIHTHGEIHPPGTSLPPIIVKNGQVTHPMSQMINLPSQFGPNIESHLIFGTKGLYTVWGEFAVGSKVIPTSFTVRVE